MWLNIFCMAFEEEPRILSLVLWLNYYHFALFHCFPLFLPFLTLLIKFALCNSGKAEEDKGFLKTRAGGPRVVCVLGEGGLFPRWPCGVLFGFGLMIFLCKMEASVLVLMCPTLCSPTDGSPPGSSVHGMSQQEYWSGLPFPSPGHLPDPGVKVTSLALAGRKPSYVKVLELN